MEYRKKCNVCGKIFCYTDKDLQESASNAGMAALSAIGSLASTLGGGTILHTQVNNQNMHEYENKVVDYSKCPYCNSRDLSFLTGPIEEKATSTPVIETPTPKAININPSASTKSLIKRALLFLEDGDWASADSYAEACLDIDPENAMAYLCKLMVDVRVHSVDGLSTCSIPLEENKNYQKALRFADSELASTIHAISDSAKKCATEAAKENVSKDNKWFENRGTAQNLLDCCWESSVALKSDGTVIATGKNKYGECNVSKWTNIKAIAAGDHHVIGLKEDGTVVATEYQGDPQYYAGRCEVDFLKDVVAIAAKGGHTLALFDDGTVYATGSNDEGQCDVQGWKDIIDIATTDSHSLGLRKDGTVVSTKYKKNLIPDMGQRNVDNWENIVAISATRHHSLGLRADGTVVSTKATGEFEAQTKVAGWTDIIAIATGFQKSLGLKADGTVVGAGEYWDNERYSSVLKDIVAISNGIHHNLFLKKDGTVIAITTVKGRDPKEDKQLDVSEWKLTNATNLIEITMRQNTVRAEQIKAQDEIKKAKLIEDKKRQLESMERRKKEIEETIPSIKGLFAKGKIQKLENELAELSEKVEEIKSFLETK